MHYAIKEAIKTIQVYETASSFRIAKYLDIDILEYSKLPYETLALTVKSDDEATIIVSSNLNYYQKSFVVAHELGHILLHKEFCTIFMRKQRKGLNIPLIEREANEFAFYLVLYDLNSENIQYNKFDIVKTLGFPDDMARFIVTKYYDIRN